MMLSQIFWQALTMPFEQALEEAHGWMLLYTVCGEAGQFEAWRAAHDKASSLLLACYGWTELPERAESLQDDMISFEELACQVCGCYPCHCDWIDDPPYYSRAEEQADIANAAYWDTRSRYDPHKYDYLKYE